MRNSAHHQLLIFTILRLPLLSYILCHVRWTDRSNWSWLDRLGRGKKREKDWNLINSFPGLCFQLLFSLLARSSTCVCAVCLPFKAFSSTRLIRFLFAFFRVFSLLFFLNMWFCFWDASRSCKTHPGPVIHLSDCPTDPSKVKIITKWNYILKVKDSGCHVYSLENFPGLAFSPDRITQLITLCTYTSEWEKLWRDCQCQHTGNWLSLPKIWVPSIRFHPGAIHFNSVSDLFPIGLFSPPFLAQSHGRIFRTSSSPFCVLVKSPWAFRRLLGIGLSVRHFQETSYSYYNLFFYFNLFGKLEKKPFRG